MFKDETTKSDQQRLTQHLPTAPAGQAGKRFVPYGTHPNQALISEGGKKGVKS